MTDAPPLPDCQDCGACCFTDQTYYVFLWGSDHDRLTRDEQKRWTIFEGTHCYMRMDEGHCVALTAENNRFTCSIYPRRPMLCHELQRGDPGCEASRELFLSAAQEWLKKRTS